MSENPNNPNPSEEPTERREEIRVKADDLVARVKELVQEGNVRRLIIRRQDGDVLMEIPLTASVIAGSTLLVLTPVFAALGALVAFIAEVRIEVVRVGEKKKNDSAETTDSETKQRIDID